MIIYHSPSHDFAMIYHEHDSFCRVLGLLMDADIRGGGEGELIK